MKLSEAMRLGSTLGPHIKYYLYRDANDGSCAMGLAQRAMGFKSSYIRYASLWPWLMEWKKLSCPADYCAKRCCRSIYTRGYGLIEHLNDYHSWTVDQIADYVATIEPQEEVHLMEVADVPLRDLQAV